MRRLGHSRAARRAAAIAASSLALTAVALTAVGCGGNSDVSSQLDEIADSVERPIERLSQAIDGARASDRASLVELRATAERAGTALADARRDARDLEDSADGANREKVRDLEGALDDYESLADAVSRSTLSAATIEVAAERARQAARDSRVALPTLDATALVAVLRKARGTRAITQGGASKPVGPGGSSTPPARVSYTDYNGPAFQAKIPTGAGWAAPAQSEPTPGRLYRTNVRGPNGLFVIIDFTPSEAATFNGRYQSKSQVGQTAFGSATRYVFQGGSLPECQRSTCFDYIINSGGAGFAVLAGGGSSASGIAQTVAESVTPTIDYGE